MDDFDGEQFQTGAEEDDGDCQYFQTDELYWEQVGSPVRLPVDLVASEGGGEAGVDLGVGPLPPQPLPQGPPLRRSARPSTAVLLIRAEQEQSLGKSSDGNPIYENPELLDNYFEETYIEHGNAKDVANGNLVESNYNGNGRLVAPLDMNSIAHLFRDATWLQSSNTFSPEPLLYLKDQPI